MMSKIAAMNKEVPLACMLLTEAQLHGVKRLADKKYRYVSLHYLSEKNTISEQMARQIVKRDD